MQYLYMTLVSCRVHHVCWSVSSFPRPLPAVSLVARVLISGWPRVTLGQHLGTWSDTHGGWLSFLGENHRITIGKWWFNGILTGFALW